MLAIFDIDGTVIDTQSAEGECFARAIREITGVSIESDDWSKFENITSSGVFRECTKGRPDLASLEHKLEERFLELLKEAQPTFPEEFSPITGSRAFIESLVGTDGIDVAFATGCYASEARFKLDCCEIDLDAFPYATASDSTRRHEIIQLAIERSKGDSSKALYFGDGTWDFHATKAINMPMIGIGRKIEKLKELGVAFTFTDYSMPDRIFEAMTSTLGNREVS